MGCSARAGDAIVIATGGFCHLANVAELVKSPNRKAVTFATGSFFACKWGVMTVAELVSFSIGQPVQPPHESLADFRQVDSPVRQRRRSTSRPEQVADSTANDQANPAIFVVLADHRGSFYRPKFVGLSPPVGRLPHVT